MFGHILMMTYTNNIGIYRSFEELLGHRDLAVTFDIWDHRPSVQDRKYKVTFTK